MGRNLKGVDVSGRHKAADLCMVLGCNKAALYRSPTTAKQGVRRGYCATHKALAMTGAPTFNYRVPGHWN